jgi:polyisoprenoid-binding protein YceI
MKKLTTLILVSFATLALAAGGCKKKKEDGGTPVAGSGSDMAGSSMAGSSMAGSGSDMAGSSMAGSSMAGSGSDMAGSGSSMAGSGSAATTDDTADKLEIVADHIDKSKGAVTVVFPGVKVIKADFDPAKIEGGTAEIEVDATNLSTGIEKRDNHVKSKDYLEVEKFPKVSIKVGNVKKTGDKTYTADATVKIHDVEKKKLPVTFEVVDSGPDWIRIKGECKFSRLDFKVGKEGGDETVEPALTAKLQVTLKKS